MTSNPVLRRPSMTTIHLGPALPSRVEDSGVAYGREADGISAAQRVEQSGFDRFGACINS